MDLQILSSLQVQDPRQAELLVHPQKRLRLVPFLGRENTVKDAAEELGISLSLMHHHVLALLDLGLLKIVREQPRAGKPLRIYRTVADEFYVPFELMPLDTLQQGLLKDEEPWRERFVRGMQRATLHLETPGQGWGVKVRRDQQGAFDVTTSLGPGSQEVPMMDLPIWSNWTEVLLTPQQAMELRAEMQALWERHRKNTTGQPYLLRMGLAPAPD